ncbi:branched-chain amino acid aminotransferase [Paremcibacter congregatus]|uniref:Branched-chain-amino-acid aminotransferase n=1 Tax=Paremcibacter congregatus TaxID=2043170 RepID=A0A2G4YTI1_9PROT|nr:branched-chain amino acid aminotransferase [Paremcibacter congregatus]PHZ84746.1 branched chain amino acid aminotransferase [Paremcibacter congregatus]QDE28938.1 branched-chain amino acid aminotransferase [Paremcibacter congregatus]
MYIRQDILDAVAAKKMPEDRTFGKAVLPAICVAQYKNGQWSEVELGFDRDHRLSGGSTAVQYAQSIFEGMKAYFVHQVTPQIFRPYDHAVRFRRSAERMCMPPVPREMFVYGVNLLSRLYADVIPREADGALYLRPSLYGTDYSLSIEPSESYQFTIHAAPTIPFSKDMKSVLIERRNSRSAVGGTGGVKAAGNYAAGFQSLTRARQLGCATSLWLDPLESKYIEELSLMNFFVVREGELHTPTLQNSFLPGITRQSLLTLAEDLGLRIAERRIDINELIKEIETGSVTEAFSCGTAAVVSPIRSLKEASGTEYVFSDEPGPITRTLRKQLLDIQEGRTADRFGWMQSV